MREISGVTSSTASTCRSTDIAAGASASCHCVASESWSTTVRGESIRTRITLPRTSRLNPSAYCSNAVCREGAGCTSTDHIPTTIHTPASGTIAIRSQPRKAARATPNSNTKATSSKTAGRQCQAINSPSANHTAAAIKGARRNSSGSSRDPPRAHSLGSGPSFRFGRQNSAR